MRWLEVILMAEAAEATAPPRPYFCPTPRAGDDSMAIKNADKIDALAKQVDELTKRTHRLEGAHDCHGAARLPLDERVSRLEHHSYSEATSRAYAAEQRIEAIENDVKTVAYANNIVNERVNSALEGIALIMGETTRFSVDTVAAMERLLGLVLQIGEAAAGDITQLEVDLGEAVIGVDRHDAELASLNDQIQGSAHKRKALAKRVYKLETEVHDLHVDMGQVVDIIANDDDEAVHCCNETWERCEDCPLDEPNSINDDHLDDPHAPEPAGSVPADLRDWFPRLPNAGAIRQEEAEARRKLRERYGSCVVETDTAFRGRLLPSTPTGWSEELIAATGVRLDDLAWHYLGLRRHVYPERTIKVAAEPEAIKTPWGHFFP